jgi:hypothetical protein
MRLAVHGLLLCAGAISAQSLVAPSRIAEAAALMEPHADEPSLSCTVKTVKPDVNYAFRFEAGYSFQVPLNRYSGPGHTWTVLTEVTPQAGTGKPVYLVNTLDLLKLDKIGANLGSTGAYVLGEGRYRVRWLLLDDLGRICRKSWQMEADRKGKLVALPPDTVSGLSLSRVAQARLYTDPGTPLRLTVLLDASHFDVKSGTSELKAGDRSELFNGLAGLLERLPTASVRLVMFNLQLQRELLRRENFTLGDMQSVTEVLKGLNLGAVRLNVLEKPKGHIELLAGLLNSEIRSTPPADAVVFLGAQERYSDKVPDGVLDAPSGDRPHFFSVQFVPFPQWVLAPAPGQGRRETSGATPVIVGDFDTVNNVIRKLKGKAIQVRTADEFEKAIQAIELTGGPGGGRASR